MRTVWKSSAATSEDNVAKKKQKEYQMMFLQSGHFNPRWHAGRIEGTHVLTEPSRAILKGEVLVVEDKRRAGFGEESRLLCRSADGMWAWLPDWELALPN